MQTGRLFTGGIEHPHVGCVLGYLKGGRGEVPAHVLLPRPIGRTGGNLPHGQTAGYLGKPHDPFILNADPSTPELQGARPAAAGLHLRPCGPSAGRSCATPSTAALAAFENNAAGEAARRQLQPGLQLMSSARRPARRSPWRRSRPTIRDRYGRTRFGQSLPAGPPADRGAACASSPSTCSRRSSTRSPGTSTARKPFTDIAEMSKQVAPNFDQAYTRAARRPARPRPAVEHDGDGDGRVRPDAEDQPGRRPRPPPRRLDDPDGRRADQGRPGRRRVGRAGLRARRRGR